MTISGAVLRFNCGFTIPLTMTISGACDGADFRRSINRLFFTSFSQQTTRWPSSSGWPGGVHLGRSGPVWQAKRLGQSRSLHDTLVRNTAGRNDDVTPETTISSSDGRRPIPLIGLGTATPMLIGLGTATPIVNSDEVKAAVIEAIKVGYRHFDTAAVYKTEKPVGEAIAEALRLGLIKSRTEVFISTKLWCNSTQRHLVLPAMKQSLCDLGLEYVDLYLIHWPLTLKQEEFKIPIPKECIASINIKDVWEEMEKCQNLGLTKSIGVSNFSPRRIEEILSFAKIPPAVNQVEMNPLWQQKKLIEFCKKNDILVIGYSPLGSPGTRWGHNRVMECDALQDISKSRGKTIAQITLRWIYEQGVCVVVKSFNTERMKQNVDIFGWSLTADELNKISQIPQQKHIYLIGILVNEPNDVMAEIDVDLSFQ